MTGWYTFFLFLEFHHDLMITRSWAVMICCRSYLGAPAVSSWPYIDAECFVAVSLVADTGANVTSNI